MPPPPPHPTTYRHDVEDELPQEGDSGNPGDVARDEREGVPRRGAEVAREDRRLHVGVLVYEPQAVLEAPEAAHAAARHVLDHLVAGSLGLLPDVRQHRLDELCIG